MIHNTKFACAQKKKIIILNFVTVAGQEAGHPG